MPIQIGAKPENDFTNPLGLLSDCHRRIEYFLGLLITITRQACGAELTGEQGRALETALRYFDKAAPRHTLDEDESLFPRMRTLKDPRVQSALTTLDALHEDHRRADALHREVDALGRQWLAENSLSPDAAHRLSALLEELSEIYQRHIALEDAEVFPLAGVTLSKTDLESMGQEMARRRGIPFQPSLSDIQEVDGPSLP